MRLAFVAALFFALQPALAQSHPAPQKPADDTPIDNGARFIGPEGYTWGAQTGTRPYNLTLHKGAYRIELHLDDRWPHDVAQGRTKKNRTEISGLQAPMQGRSTLQYEVMVEQADFSAPHVEHILGQRHGKGDPEDKIGESPDIAFRILPGGAPAFSIAGSTEQPLVNLPKSVAAWTGTADQFALKKWHTVRIDAMQAAPGQEGWVDLWLDGDWKKAPGAAHTFTGPWGYVNAAPDYWKFGDYCWTGLATPVVVWYRNIHLDAK